MSGFAPRLEILPPAQRELWPLLAPGIGLGFVLYGGTAVALRLGHRSSIDFDLFTERQIDRDALETEFSFISASKVLQDRMNSLTFLAMRPGGEVKVSFFGGITFGRVGTPDRTPDDVMSVASLVDLLATKLKVIQQRIEAKDYRDIAAMLRADVRLETGLGAATALFGPSFQPNEAIKALTYFEGGDLAGLDARDRKALVQAVSRIRHIPATHIASRSLSAS